MRASNTVRTFVTGLALMVCGVGGSVRGEGMGHILQVPLGEAGSQVQSAEGEAVPATGARVSVEPTANQAITMAGMVGPAPAGDLVLTGRAIPGMKVEAMALYDAVQIFPQSVELFLLFTPGLSKSLSIGSGEEIQGTMDWNAGTYRIVIPGTARTLRPKSLDWADVRIFVPGSGWHMVGIGTRSKAQPRDDHTRLESVARFQVARDGSRMLSPIDRGGQALGSYPGLRYSVDRRRPGQHRIDFELAPR